MESVKTISMIDDLRMKVADNGFVICWYEKVPRQKTPGQETYGDDYRYEDHEEVFPFADKEKAVTRLMDLAEGMKK